MLAVPPRIELVRRPLDTPRLILVPIETSDAAELWSAVDSSRAELEPWLPWVPFNTDQDASYRYAEASSQDWDNARACRFGIRDKKTRRLYGVVGLEAFAHLHQSVELGYWLRTDATGHGYMTEASRALIQWAFSTLHAHRIRVAAATDNRASLAVIGRLAFHFEGIARQAERCHGRWLDHAVFGMIDADARA